jgi:hypothetical protein
MGITDTGKEGRLDIFREFSAKPVRALAFESGDADARLSA